MVNFTRVDICSAGAFRLALPQADTNRNLLLANGQEDASNEQIARKTNREKGNGESDRTRSLREMRNVDSAGKRAEIALENIFLLGKLYGKSRRSQLANYFLRNKSFDIPANDLLAEQQRDD